MTWMRPVELMRYQLSTSAVKHKPYLNMFKRQANNVAHSLVKTSCLYVSSLVWFEFSF